MLSCVGSIFVFVFPFFFCWCWNNFTQESIKFGWLWFDSRLIYVIWLRGKCCVSGNWRASITTPVSWRGWQRGQIEDCSACCFSSILVSGPWHMPAACWWTKWSTIVAIIKITSFTCHSCVCVCVSVSACVLLWFCGFVVDVFLVYCLALRMRHTHLSTHILTHLRLGWAEHLWPLPNCM